MRNLRPTHPALTWLAVAVLGLAAQLAAQDKPKKPHPREELAAMIAAEEQEGDLAKAERLYREALAGSDLSVAARAWANLRLGNLLKKLGRKDEAYAFLEEASKSSVLVVDGETGPGQDSERTWELRGQAREIIEKLRQNKSIGGWGGPLHGIPSTQLSNQLLWIGEAAVPEVIAALQDAMPKVKMSRGDDGLQLANFVSGLAGFLWRTGGDAAASYLASCTKAENVAFRVYVAKTAFQARSERMLEVACRFLADPAPDGSVTSALLFTEPRGGGNGTLANLLPADQVVRSALAGPPAALGSIFRWAMSPREVAPELLDRLHDRVEAILASTDPEVGAQAHRFLCSTTSQRSVRGIHLLLAALPDMRGTAAPSTRSQPYEFTEAQARALVPAIDRCMARYEPNGASRNWMMQLMWNVIEKHGDGAVAPLLRWFDGGMHEIGGLLAGRITAANVLDLIPHIRGSKSRIDAVLYAMSRIDHLPEAAFPGLRERAEAVRGSYEDMTNFARPMANTRHPGAAEWLRQEYESKHNDKLIGSTVRLARWVRTEEMKRALHAFAVSATYRDRQGRGGNAQPLLALLTMGDAEALEWVGKGVALGSTARHPFAEGEDAPRLTPFQYLVYRPHEGIPTHPFGRDEVVGVIGAVTEPGFEDAMDPGRFSIDAINDVYFVAVVEGALTRFANHRDRIAEKWLKVAARAWRGEERPERAAALRAWVVAVLRSDDAARRLRLLEVLQRDDGARFEAPLVELLRKSAGSEAARIGKVLRLADWVRDRERLALLTSHVEPAVRVAGAGAAEELGIEVADLVLPLLDDEVRGVRFAAVQYAGRVVTRDAVPQLIALLRDPEATVREAASEALTRIRFYHEQQAHWDRVLKGVDASPASATEKLLMQSKPDQEKAQRLLAIKSLGVLGQAEALPFLIDWAGETDKEIAAAAKAAITAIHLRGGAGSKGK